MHELGASERSMTSSGSVDAVPARWLAPAALVNVRGPFHVPAFAAAVAATAGVLTPTRFGDAPGALAASAAAMTAATMTAATRTAAATPDDDGARLLWIGPDDAFLRVPGMAPAELTARLERAVAAVADTHAAVTDVSSGYCVCAIGQPGDGGEAAEALLAAGCPLALDPRSLPPGRVAGTHWFKASVWLWRGESPDLVLLLVRRSFRDYVEHLMQRVHAAG